jgi:hypothetical protein
MASTTTDTYDQVGIREDLADIIYDVSPEETPFFSNAGKMDVDSTKFEWQTDSLASVSTTVAVEGADASFAAASPTARLDNQTEIITKTAVTSGTLEATDRAGRAREMAYQLVKRGKELRRDAEHHLVGIHNPKAAGNATTARETASYATWIKTNASVGAGGNVTNGGLGTHAPTVGTARAFTETLLGDVIDSCWNAGGNPNIIMCGSFQKRVLNGFAGNADSRDVKAEGKKVINAISVYESDYGLMKVVPNRFCKSTDVLVYEQDYWKIAILRPMQSKEIARTGDAEKRQILMEYGLCAANEASSGAIFSLNDS